MNYDVVIGIEVHAELKTKTKMFSQASSDFNQKSNQGVALTDFGLPGSLPSVNLKAVELALRACLALNMEIDPLLQFDRKCYFYPDLPKGYQITQQYFPIGKKGSLKLKDKVVNITRLHLEEDTARQFHEGDKTLIDFNRSGNPLIEIVSDPDLSSALEAMEYVDKLRLLLLYAGVSDAKMEEGSLRCDINVSLKKPGTKELGAKVEIKNLNSISNIGRALEFEIKRQSELLGLNQEIVEATMRYDEKSRQTVLMRDKDDQVNYHYIVEGNILPIKLEAEFLNQIKTNLPTLPEMYYEKLASYHVSKKDSEVLINNYDLLSFFLKTTPLTKEPLEVVKWLLSDILGYLNKNEVKISETKLSAESLVELIDLVNSETISNTQAKTILPFVMKGQKPSVVISEQGLSLDSDEAGLLEIINDLIAKHPEAVQDYKNGKDRIVGFLVGKVMQATKGQANPALTNKLVVSELKKQ